ncbi:MAG: hypothetical protein PHG16_12285 [Lachnospiraceae bacterium]|nr:hypothetical protein [Lachnospiraceae bacterium]
MDAAMPIFLDDISFYLSTMEAFLEENAIEKVYACMKAKDYESAANYAFDMKSLTGMLGMLHAYEASKDMCRKFKNGQLEAVSEDITKIRNWYEKLAGLEWGIPH